MDPAATLAAPLDDVVDRRAEPARLLEPQPELDALDDVDAHDRRGQRGVEPAVPVDVRAEPDRQPVGDDLEHAADRVAVRARLVDPGDHRRLGLGVRAAQRRRVGLVPRAASPVAGSTATPPTSAVNDQTSMPSSRRNARATPPAATRAAVSRADARSRTFRTSLKPYLSAPARSAWPGRTRVTGVARLLPSAAAAASSAASSSLSASTCMTRVQFSQSRFATSSRIGEPSVSPVADAGDDLGPVLLDRLARAAAVAALAAGEVDGELVGRQREPGRDALERDAERRAVRFAGGQEAESAHDVGPPISRGGAPAARRAASVPAARRPSAAVVAGRLALGRADAAGPRLVQLLLHQLERRRLARSTA